MIGFRMPTRVHVAPGALGRTGEVVASLGLRRPLFVLDRGLRSTPWPDSVRASLRAAGAEPVDFDELEANPRTRTADRAGELAAAEGCDGVVALGGGSALDAAKAAAVVAADPVSRSAALAGRERYRRPPLPMIALPTTCGTGSEVTWVSVLTDPDRGVKISVKGESMFPRQALVDARTLDTLPPSLVAQTGADALTHALEATTCTVANAVSDALAEQATLLLLEHLAAAVEGGPSAAAARAQVMRASTLAGLAFGNADVAGVHCLSESLGGLLDVPHGLANAVLLRPVLASHRPFVDRRLAELERRLDPRAAKDEADAASAFLERLRRLTTRIAIPSFAALEVPRESFARLARMSVENGSNSSNPRPMDEAAYLRLLESLAEGTAS